MNDIHISKCAKCGKNLNLLDNNTKQEGWTDEQDRYCSPDCLQSVYPEYDRNAKITDKSKLYYTTWEVEENEK